MPLFIEPTALLHVGIDSLTCCCLLTRFPLPPLFQSADRKTSDWQPLILPTDSPVRALYVEQSSDADCLLMLTQNHELFAAGALAQMSLSLNPKKRDGLDGGVIQVFRTDAEDPVQHVALSRGRVFVALDSGRIVCLEPEQLGHKGRPDGTRLNSAGHWAKKEDGHYFCGRKHANCRCKRGKCTLCTSKAKCKCRACQHLDDEDRRLSRFGKSVTTSLHPHPMANLLKLSSNDSNSKECAHCKAKLVKDVFVSTAPTHYRSFRLCQTCVLQHVVSDIALNVKTITLAEADIPVSMLAVTQGRVFALSSDGRVFDSAPPPLLPAAAAEATEDPKAEGAAGPSLEAGAGVVSAAVTPAPAAVLVQATEPSGEASPVADCVHLFAEVRSKARVCPRCLGCTEAGKKCYRAASANRTAGELCGCGDGHPGCSKCGLCRSCAEAKEGEGAEDGAGAAAGEHGAAAMDGAAADVAAVDDDAAAAKNADSGPGSELTAFLQRALPKLEAVNGAALGWEQDTVVVKLVAGGGFVLGLTAAGGLLAAGSNNNGQLGLPLSVLSTKSLVPVPLPDGMRARDVAAGARHALVVLVDGRVLSFGDNRQAQLGRETEAGKAKAVPLSADGIAPFDSPVTRAVAVGHSSFLWYGEEVVPRSVVAKAQCTATADALLLTYQAAGGETATAAFNLSSGNFAWSDNVPDLQQEKTEDKDKGAGLCYDWTQNVLFALSAVSWCMTHGRGERERE